MRRASARCCARPWPSESRRPRARERSPWTCSPSAAVRSCERTSLGVAVDLVSSGEADAVVSAGNSGAFSRSRSSSCARSKGSRVRRSRPCGRRSTARRFCSTPGANVDCRPEWLEQFGIMGSAYAKAVLEHREPRVAVLSVGEERSKGNQLVARSGARCSRRRRSVSSATSKGANLPQRRRRDRRRRIRRKRRAQDRRRHDRRPRARDARALLGGNSLTKVGDGDARAGACSACAGSSTTKPTAARRCSGLRGNCIVTHGRSSRNAIKHAIKAAAEEVEHDVVGKSAELIAPHSDVADRQSRRRCSASTFICRSAPYICPYCDFAKWPMRVRARPLSGSALRRDRARVAREPAATIFLGGGTPNAYDAETIAAAVGRAARALRRARRSVSIEVNPELVREGDFAAVSRRRHHAALDRRAVIRAGRDRDARAQAHAEQMSSASSRRRALPGCVGFARFDVRGSGANAGRAGGARSSARSRSAWITFRPTG